MHNPARLVKVRLRRRLLLLAIYGTCALTMSAALAVAGGGGAAAPAAATPATGGRSGVSPADKTAAEAQFDKANALYQQKKYAEAQVENDKALKLDPTNMHAILMQSTLKDLLAGGVVAPATGTAATSAGDGKLTVLTAQQISLVRLMELGAGDTRVLGKIDPKVVEDFWESVILKDALGDKSQAAHNAFINPSNFAGQARRMRDSHDMKYLSQISVTTDPVTFTTYRNNVSTYVLQNCATAECHGGDKSPGGGFHMINPATSSEQHYTNFYILSQFGNADGKMIDRETPDKSLLLQYALPWQASVLKHPKLDVKKLTGTNDGRARPILEWIRSLVRPKPEYGIEYVVPRGPATAPASASGPAPK